MPPHMDANKSDIPMHMQQKLKDCSKSSKMLGGNDFRPITRLGRGNMGTVLLVALKSSNLPFAVKVMKKDSSRKHRLQRIQTERDILSMLEHPFLPSLHAYFESERYAFLVMDFCSGGDLNVLRQKQPEKKFSEAAAQFYAAEVLVALQYLHKHGIVYRDLKPENVLVHESGHIMLTDFDLSIRLEGGFTTPNVQKLTNSKAKQPSRKLVSGFNCLSPWFACRKAKTQASRDMSAQTGQGSIAPLEISIRKENQKDGELYSFVGTEEYIAPEILWNRGHGFPVDWWAFGIFLYELIYGATPFRGASRKETFVNILGNDPEFSVSWSPLKDLIQKLLVKEPADRLGCSVEGADAIKRHEFFAGVRWDFLSDMVRPPFIPPPFSLPEFEKGAKIKKRSSRKGSRKPERDDSCNTYSRGNSDTSSAVSMEEMFTKKETMQAGGEEGDGR